MFGISSFAQTPFASLAGTAFTAALSEDITLADSSTQIFAFNQSFVENFGISNTENTDGGSTFFLDTSETLTSGDSSTQLSAFLQSLSENSNPNDDTGISTLYIFEVAENQTMADDPVPYFAALQDRSEPIISVQDSSTQQSVFLQAIIENTTLAEAITNVVQFLQTVTENITLADTPLIEAQFATSITENSTLEDSFLFMIVFTITENLNSADSSTQVSTFLQSLSENIVSADLSTQTFAFLQSRVEPFTVSDLAASGGWFKINNDQSVTWVPINNSQP
jgi:hypothetical protein